MGNEGTPHMTTFLIVLVVVLMLALGGALYVVLEMGRSGRWKV